MAVKPILMFGNDLLRQPCGKVDVNTDPVNTWVTDLADTLHRAQAEKKIGRALAAPQIGCPKQIVLMDAGGRRIVMINPEIIAHSENTFDVWDSCFSADVAFFGLTRRYREITVRWIDDKRTPVRRVFRDDLSELFQHEIDHLHGILFIDRIVDNRIIMRSEWEKRYRRAGNTRGPDPTLSPDRTP